MYSLSLEHLQERPHQRLASQYARGLISEALGGAGRKKIVLVVGNAIHARPKTREADGEKGGLYGNEFIRKDKLVRTLREIGAGASGHGSIKLNEYRALWLYHESLRLLSSSKLPRPALTYLYYLLMRDMVDLVITSNYDLFLESISQKVEPPKICFALNPVGKTTRPDAHDGYGEQPSGSHIILAKYHGDVGHVLFLDGCRCLFRLPLDPALPHTTVMHSLEQVLKACQKDDDDELLLQLRRRHGHLRGKAEPYHFIDYNFPKVPRDKLFSYEIKAVERWIAKLSPSNTAGFLIVGFAGRWVSGRDRMSEEIVWPLVEKAREGIPATMIFLPKDESEFRDSTLARELFKVNPYQLWIGDVITHLDELFWSFRELRPGLLMRQGWKHSGLFL